MGVSIDFDDYTTQLFIKLLDQNGLWLSHMEEFATKIGEDAREYMKPFTTAKSKWHGQTHGTGSMADSIKENVTMIGTGFGVTFNGNFYGNYLDVGNFPASSTITRPNGKRFPIGLRAGQEGEDLTFRYEVHGIGNYNPADWPAKFSEKTAVWLASDEKLQEYCDAFIGGFLKELVMP